MPPLNNCHLIVGWYCFLAVTFFAIAHWAAHVMGGNLYLYHDKDDDAASPVLDLLVPDRAGGDGHHHDDAALHPDFLYQPLSAPAFAPPARVVEFYAPWCGHCQHFAPKYKALAREITASHPAVRFYAVSCVAHGALCKEQGVHSYPTLKTFREGSYDGIGGGEREANVTAFLRELGLAEEAGAGGGAGAGDQPAAAENPDAARVVPFRALDARDAWADAAHSFEYALAHNVYMENGPLPEEKRAALRAWLGLLALALPPGMGRTRGLVARLRARFEHVAGAQAHLDEVAGDRARSHEGWTWRTCTYGDNAMGYTCGLWQLFHVVAVGVVEHNRQGSPLPTRHVAETLRNYIDHFFQCDVCRINFLAMYDTCAFDGCHRLSETSSDSEREWQELPLWLWETHNDVNVRLLGERLEQNNMDKPTPLESQQARWPSSSACPNCWREDGSWEEERVFEHLRTSYWTGSPSPVRISSNHVASGPSPRVVPLKWKFAVAFFVVAVLVARKPRPKRKKRHKK